MVLAVGVSAGTQAAEHESSKSALSPREQLAEKLLLGVERHATWIGEGKGNHIVYVFFDPNCPYCQKLFMNLRPYVEKGGFQARWIPVGILMASSHGKAAALLDAKDPLQALRHNEEHYVRGDGFGGIEEELMPSDKTEKALDTNAQLLSMSGAPGVPLMLFRTKEGPVVFISGGPPEDKLKEILGYVK